MKYPKKSRSLRRIARRTPGGRNVIHLEPRKAGKAHCAQCKHTLNGIHNYGAKSEKKTARPFGGYLCSACMRKVFVGQARGKHV